MTLAVIQNTPLGESWQGSTCGLSPRRDTQPQGGASRPTPRLWGSWRDWGSGAVPSVGADGLPWLGCLPYVWREGASTHTAPSLTLSAPALSSVPLLSLYQLPKLRTERPFKSIGPKNSQQCSPRSMR